MESFTPPPKDQQISSVKLPTPTSISSEGEPTRTSVISDGANVPTNVERSPINSSTTEVAKNDSGSSIEGFDHLSPARSADEIKQSFLSPFSDSSGSDVGLGIIFTPTSSIGAGVAESSAPKSTRSRDDFLLSPFRTSSTLSTGSMMYTPCSSSTGERSKAAHKEKYLTSPSGEPLAMSISSDGIPTPGSSQFEGDVDSPTDQRKVKYPRPVLPSTPPRIPHSKPNVRFTHSVYSAPPVEDGLETPPSIRKLVDEAENNTKSEETLAQLRQPLNFGPLEPTLDELDRMIILKSEQFKRLGNVSMSNSEDTPDSVSQTELSTPTKADDNMDLASQTGSATPTNSPKPKIPTSPVPSIGSPEAQFARFPPTPEEKGANKFYSSKTIVEAQLAELPPSPPETRDFVEEEYTTLFLKLLINACTIIYMVYRTIRRGLVCGYDALVPRIFKTDAYQTIVYFSKSMLKIAGVLFLATMIFSVFANKTSRDLCTNHNLCIPNYSNISISNIKNYWQTSPRPPSPYAAPYPSPYTPVSPQKTQEPSQNRISLTTTWAQSKGSVVDHIKEVADQSMQASSNYEPIKQLHHDAYFIGQICLEALRHPLAKKERQITDVNKQRHAQIVHLQTYLASLVESKIQNLPSPEILKLAHSELFTAEGILSRMKKNTDPGRTVRIDTTSLQKSMIDSLQNILDHSVILKAKIDEGYELLQEISSQKRNLEIQFDRNYKKLTQGLYNKDWSAVYWSMYPSDFVPKKIDREFRAREEKESDLDDDKQVARLQFNVAVDNMTRYLVDQRAALIEIIDKSQAYSVALANPINYTEDVADVASVEKVHEVVVEFWRHVSMGENARMVLRRRVCAKEF